MASMIPLDSSKLHESLDKIEWVGKKHTPIYIKGNGKKEMYIYIYVCVCEFKKKLLLLLSYKMTLLIFMPFTTKRRKIK